MFYYDETQSHLPSDSNLQYLFSTIARYVKGNKKYIYTYQLLTGIKGELQSTKTSRYEHERYPQPAFPTAKLPESPSVKNYHNRATTSD